MTELRNEGKTYKTTIQVATSIKLQFIGTAIGMAIVYYGLRAAAPLSQFVCLIISALVGYCIHKIRMSVFKKKDTTRSSFAKSISLFTTSIAQI